MNTSLWLQNLAAYSLQVAFVATLGLLLPWALRLSWPRILYAYWQALLAICLLLPLIQPWHRFDAEKSATAAVGILMGSNLRLPHMATLSAAGWVLLVLASGVIIRLLWLAMGLVQLRRYGANAQPIEFPPPGVQEMANHLGVAPAFCLAKEVHSPVTFGVWRPVIMFPLCFNEMDAARQRVIASHELLHIARHDWAMNFAEEIVLAAFWFHPVVWWLVGRIRLSREQVVDKQVVELTGARKHYLCALLEIAARPIEICDLPGPAFLQEHQLVKRIRSLIKEDFMSKPRLIISLVCLVVVTLVVGLVIIKRFPLRTSGISTVASNHIQAGYETFTIGNGVSEPIPTYKPDPPYTKEARAAKIQGTVVLQAIIGADGNVKDATIVKPLDPGLDQNAVETIRTWTFKPALKAGAPVACKVMVEVSFRMF